MDIATLVIILVFGLLLCIGFVVIGIYNKLKFYHSRVLVKFHAVSDCLDSRINMIDKIVNFIYNQGYSEDALVMDLNKLALEIKDEINVNNLLELIDKSDKIIMRALVLDGVYEELVESSEYADMIEEFKNNQYKIMYSIEIYNEQVKEYNTYRSKRVVRLVSKIFKFQDYNYYKKRNGVSA